MIKFTSIILSLFFSNFLFGAEKCHLGSEDIKGYKKCNLDIMSPLGGSNKPRYKVTKLYICSYWQDVEDLSKYTFYSQSGKFKFIYKKYTAFNPGHCPEYGKDKDGLNYAGVLRFEADKKVKLPVLGFKQNVEIQDIQPLSIYFEYKALSSKDKKKYREIIVKNQIQLYGKNYIGRHPEGAYDECNCFADEYEKLKIISCFYGKAEGEPMFRYIFNDKDKLLLILDPTNDGAGRIFKPQFSFIYSGIRYIFVKATFDGGYAYVLFYRVDGKTYFIRKKMNE